MRHLTVCRCIMVEICYDSEDSEYDPLEMERAACVANYDFDNPEGIESKTYTRCRPDGGEARIVGEVDIVPHVSECVMCHAK